MTTVISRDLFRRIEYELYSYQTNKSKIDSERSKILHGSPPPAGGLGSSGVSDPTCRKASKLAELDESEQARWVRCLDDALRGMSEKKQTLVKLKYFQHLKAEIIARRLRIGRTSYFSLRENVILTIALVAAQRGLIKTTAEGRRGVK